jgi:D-glycero-alpha-D-manno-heptose-7-phosphate kinase
MGQMVDVGLEILTDSNANIDNFGALLDEAWQYKKSLTDLISSDEIDDIYSKAKKAGAIGGKILGAGGGGFFSVVRASRLA